MPEREKDQDQEENERPRPRVVDKRVSSGGHRPPERTSAAEAPVETTAAGEGSEPVPAAGAGAGPGRATERSEPPTQSAAEPGRTRPPEAAVPEGTDPNVWTPEQEEEALRIAQEIAERPSIDWVVNAAVSLANVAATKLQVGDPPDAQLAIDALAGVLRAAPGRLGDAEEPLKQTLAQLQIAFAQQVAPPPEPV